MPTAILIGFQYILNKIPGVIVDLYLVNKFCNRLNWDINIISDIENVKLPHDIANNITNTPELEIYDFMTNPSDYILVRNRINFLNVLKNIKVKDDKLFVYFTGHGKKSKIILPNGDKVSHSDILNELTRDRSINLELFWIMDCCHPTSSGLEYELEDEKFKYIPNSIPTIQKILLIASSSEDQKSVSTYYGSFFTKYLFKILNDLCDENVKKWPSRNISSLSKSINKNHFFKNIGYEQKTSVYSSYRNSIILWSWIGKMKNSITIFKRRGLILITPITL
jgi:hypothetical protein